MRGRVSRTSPEPALTRVIRGGIRLLVDPMASERGVLLAFSDRVGGVSSAPFDTLNLGSMVGDDPASVERNRARVARAAEFGAEALVMSRQVHGETVAEAGARTRGRIGEADGLVARAPGPVLAIFTADCAAVVVAGRGGVALVHAGWRGLVAGVVERAASLVAPVACAWVGPCIRACCYEVGPEVIRAFEDRRLPTRGGRVDIADAARVAVGRAGAPSVALAGDCTACDDRYFSYRRDGVTGRQGAFASLLPAAEGTGARPVSGPRSAA
jgi:YfiH family protein